MSGADDISADLAARCLRRVRLDVEGPHFTRADVVGAVAEWSANHRVSDIGIDYEDDTATVRATVQVVAKPQIVSIRFDGVSARVDETP